jgi:uncharacterized protein YndB with AHSA1/START domain
VTVTITPAPIRKTVHVTAPPDRAFTFFTQRMGRWWPRAHTLLGAPQQDVVIEPRLGGRWYERGVDGSEYDWGRVLAWEPPERIVLAWQLDADWHYDPDLITEVEVRFVAVEAEATRVEVEHRRLENYGARAAETRERLDSPDAWRSTLDRYAEIASREA